MRPQLFPAVLFWLLLLVVLWGAFAIFTGFALAYHERAGGSCASSPPRKRGEDTAVFQFEPRNPCQPAEFAVSKGERYFIQVEVLETWFDGTESADPSAIAAGP